MHRIAIIHIQILTLLRSQINERSSYFENWYNLLWSARWHKMEFTYTGNMAISGFDLSISVDGDE